MNRSYSKIRHIQECNRILESRLIKSVLSEKRIPNSGSMADIMSLQFDILTYELENGIAKFIDSPSGCKMWYYKNYPYSVSAPNQCMLTGSTLCPPGKPCYQKQAIDGIYGNLTQAAFDKYADAVQRFRDGTDATFGDYYNNPNYDLGKENPEWANLMVGNHQIPAIMDTIKGFQYWVWNFVEKDNESSCDSNGQNCSYKSILCGDNFCKEDKAVDGYWGTNTKKAWKKYKEQYHDKGFNAGVGYDSIYDILNN